MGIVLCPACRVANMDLAAVCHCCSAALPFNRLEVWGTGALRVKVEDDPGVLAACAETGRREARAAARAIQGAAWILVIRGTIMPFLIRHTPPGTLASLDPQSVQLISYCAAAVFVGLYFWARKDPFAAALAAILVYAGLSYPDLVDGTGILGKGIISKLVMLSVLGRALVAGIVHRLTRDPART